MNIFLLKTGFWLQLAVLPFIAVLYIFIGVAAVASWESGSLRHALETTLGVSAFFLTTGVVLASPAYATRYLSAHNGGKRKERIISSIGSGIGSLLGTLCTIASLTAGYAFSGFLWSLFLAFHIYILWMVNCPD